ncbi:ficolin-2-like [Asterias rubens]|uniref:ficolin-2-like n=1 Tax=Asterias rubens TaxID=7604 RepID=UPI0014550EB8|nr:ficolin-2-like [Asterias rubens]
MMMSIKQLHFENFIQRLIVMMMMMTQAFCEQQPCSNRLHQFFGSENRILENFVYRTKSTFSYINCGRDCILDPNCKSFNFLPCPNVCELNNDTRAKHFEDFLETQGSVYFDSDEETPLFSVKPSFGCYRSCKELLDAGFNLSGIYTLYRDGLSTDVYCDMEIDGGGWIVFQKRQDGSEHFYRNWTAYKTGFGDLSGEFWLGNDNLLKLTSDDPKQIWELRVDIADWDNLVAFAKYNSFKVSGEKYILYVGDFCINSSAADSLTYHHGRPFTTFDSDNDRLVEDNCARKYVGAWWFNNCVLSHLNGVYYQTGEVENHQGVLWSVENYWKQNTSQKNCSMKIRETQT